MKPIRLIALLPLLFLLSACQFSLAADVTPPPNYTPEAAPVQAQPASLSGPLYPLVAPNPADGEPIYTEKCAPCHGPQGKGDGPRAAQLPNPVAAIGDPTVARQSIPADWFKVVSEGNLQKFMPPFSNSLSERQRWDVLAYVYSLSAPAASVSHGGEVFQANCARCHGSSGKGDGSDASGLAKAPSDLTNQEFMAGKAEADFFQTATNGVSPEMPAFGDSLSEADRWDVSAYLRSLAFASPQIAVAEGTPGATHPPLATETISSTIPLTATGSLSNTESVVTITGAITNASGGAMPAGIPVLLHAFDQMSIAFTQTATTTENGNFVFNNIPLKEGRSFLATVDYNGTTYGSDITTVNPGESVVQVPISIYETTSDTSSLSVERLHLFFEASTPGMLRVIELYIISNSGNKSVVGAKEGLPSLTFQLPKGATNLEFQDGTLGNGRYVQTDTGFGDISPIRPGAGSYQVLFAFEMPYDKKLDLVQPISLPTNAVVILLPDGGLKVKGNNLQDAGTRAVQDTQYHMYNGSAMTAGQELHLTISGDPNSSAPLTTGSRNNLVIGIGALGLVLILAGGLLFVRNRRTVEAEVEEVEATPVEAATENEETLMDAILALDDLYKEGKLPEEAYLKRRAELKARLKALLDQS